MHKQSRCQTLASDLRFPSQLAKFMRQGIEMRGESAAGWLEKGLKDECKTTKRLQKNRSCGRQNGFGTLDR
jgi:hypothetical protein